MRAMIFQEATDEQLLSLMRGSNTVYKLNVAFFTTLPANPVAGVTYVNVAPSISGGTNPQRLSHGTSGELTWLINIPRDWQEKHYLYPIPESARLLNPALGQNPGW